MIEKKEKENKNTIIHQISIKRFIMLSLSSVVVFAILLLLAYETAFINQIYPQISICGIPLSGKTKKQAEDLVISQTKTEFPETILLKNNNQTYTLSLKSFDFNINRSVEGAFAVGRRGNLIQMIKTKVALLRTPLNLSFYPSFDKNETEKQIEEISGQLYSPAVNPEIKVQNTVPKTIEIELGKNGRRVDKEKLNEDIQKSLSCPKKNIVIEIPFITSQPEISPAMAEITRKRALNLLSKNLKLFLKENSWNIGEEELIGFLSFINGYDKEKIKNYVENFAKAVNKPPENAAFTFENNRVILFKPANDGLTLKEKELSEAIENRIVQIENSGQSQEIEIPVLKVPPKITNSDVNSLGIKELLGKGTSNYRGSISERIHNLNLATIRLNGLLVPPNEEFSFNLALGEVTAGTGYKRAYVIKEGKTVLDDGGGVCQVSTTLFRALLNTGLPVTERHAHAYRVSYYENDLGPGFDATVFAPWADLKFKNDTPAYLLIQSSVDAKKQMITFEIYGSSDGRTVEISKAKVYDRQPPPPDLYQDDPTLPVGVVKQIEHSIWGAKTIFDYKVTRNDEILEQKSFFSNYQPWQAIYLKGIRQ